MEENNDGEVIVNNDNLDTSVVVVENENQEEPQTTSQEEEPQTTSQEEEPQTTSQEEEPQETSQEENVIVVVPSLDKEENIDNNIEKQIDAVISSKNNNIKEENRYNFRNLYNFIRQDVINAVTGKTSGDLDFGFWMNIIVTLMVQIEKTFFKGDVTKKDMAVEVISLIIRYELPFSKEDRERIENTFRLLAPKIIETVIYASSNINVVVENVEASAKKCFKFFSCFKCCK